MTVELNPIVQRFAERSTLPVMTQERAQYPNPGRTHFSMARTLQQRKAKAP
jgi:hypothetical protein